MGAIGYVVKTMSVKVKPGTAAEVAYECAVTGVVENESHDEQTSQTACPDGSITDTGPSTWTLTVNYNVSNLPASFHRLLREHAGEAAVVTVEPFPVQEPGTLITYDVTLTPAGADYTVGSFGTASATLPVTGDPTYTDPAAADATTRAAGSADDLHDDDDSGDEPAAEWESGVDTQPMEPVRV